MRNPQISSAVRRILLSSSLSNTRAFVSRMDGRRDFEVNEIAGFRIHRLARGDARPSALACTCHENILRVKPWPWDSVQVCVQLLVQDSAMSSLLEG